MQSCADAGVHAESDGLKLFPGSLNSQELGAALENMWNWAQIMIFNDIYTYTYNYKYTYICIIYNILKYHKGFECIEL